MTVNLSIKNVPDDIADRLRARAVRNHRSVQGELMAMLESALGGVAGNELGEHRRPYRTEEKRTASEALALVQKAGRDDEERGQDMIKRMRHGRTKPVATFLDVDQVMERISALGLKEHDEATDMIREDRDR